MLAKTNEGVLILEDTMSQVTGLIFNLKSHARSRIINILFKHGTVLKCKIRVL